MHGALVRIFPNDSIGQNDLLLDDALAFIHGDGDVVNLSLNHPFLPRNQLFALEQLA